MKYRMYGATCHSHRQILRVVVKLIAVLVIVICVLVGVGFMGYRYELTPVGGNKTVAVTIAHGKTVNDIALMLKKNDLIRNEVVFIIYARLHNVSRYLQAGAYNLETSQSIPVIVAQLTHGKVATSLVTILPGQRLDEIRQSLIEQGFPATNVDAALQPAQYESAAMFVSKPDGANLEGYLYPDSFERSANTTVKSVIEQSLAEMQQHLTSDITDGFKQEGLTTYQGIILASIVTKEANNPADRAQVAQVFLKRLSIGMELGSDVTAFYGSELAGKGDDVTYDTLFNTRLHTGLPPTPISNVDEGGLTAIVHPAGTGWLYFVAGDDGTVHFSDTLQEQQALTVKYCHKLCQ